MIRISSLRLLPVVELEPRTYATKSRDSPSCAAFEAPKQWNKFWIDSLADAGIDGITAISPGSWFVLASVIASSALEIILAKELEQSGIPGFPDSDGAIEENIEDCISALAGGLAIYDGVEPLVEPSCCGDLRNLNEWRKAALDRSADWQDLWIGHPQLRFRVVNDKVEIQETQEYNLPRHPRHFVASYPHLKSAILEAEGEQKRFEGQLREALCKIPKLHTYTEKQLDRLAELLAGR